MTFRSACMWAALMTGVQTRAELWPSLEEYVSRCVLIVKAQTVAAGAGNIVSFKVLESWKGTYGPGLLKTTKDGHYATYRGEHGADVVDGQEIVFFFTRHNNPDQGPLTRHSTAFPVKDGQVVYAATALGLRKTYTLAAFKQRIGELVAAEKRAGAAPVLKPFSGRDLRALEASERQQFDKILTATPGASLSEIPGGQPWFLWEREKGAGYILFCAHPLRLIPGASRATLWILDAEGKRLSDHAFTTMYRGDLNAAEYREEKFVPGQVIRIETQPMRSEIRHYLFVALQNGRPALVRIENQEGKSVQNHYYAPNFTVGPLPPKRTPDEWAETLKAGSTTEVLEALVWLGGKHLDPADRKHDVVQEDEASVQVYRATRARDDVQARIQELSTSPNRWLAEAARQVLAGERPHR